MNDHESHETHEKNPSPEKTIASIYFESTKARAAPFLIAVTLE